MSLLGLPFQGALHRLAQLAVIQSQLAGLRFQAQDHRRQQGCSTALARRFDFSSHFQSAGGVQCNQALDPQLLVRTRHRRKVHAPIVSRAAHARQQCACRQFPRFDQTPNALGDLHRDRDVGLVVDPNAKFHHAIICTFGQPRQRRKTWLKWRQAALTSCNTFIAPVRRILPGAGVVKRETPSTDAPAHRGSIGSRPAAPAGDFGISPCSRRPSPASPVALLGGGPPSTFRHRETIARPRSRARVRFAKSSPVRCSLRCAPHAACGFALARLLHRPVCPAMYGERHSAKQVRNPASKGLR